MTRRRAELFMVFLIVLRSSTFMFNKIALAGMSPFTLLAVRFLLAFAVLLVVFRRRLAQLNRRTALYGLALGASYFLMMTAELHSLQLLPSSKVSFLENTSIVFVPLIEALLARRLPRPVSLLSAACAFAGVSLLSMYTGGISFGAGEMLCLGAALCRTAAVILTDRFARREDPVLTGVFEIGFIGLFGLSTAFLLETPALPTQPLHIGALLALTLICTVVGYTFQPLCQRYTTAERTSLFSALMPLCAGVLGMVFLGENLGAQGLFGAALILLAIFIASYHRTSAQKSA